MAASPAHRPSPPRPGRNVSREIGKRHCLLPADALRRGAGHREQPRLMKAAPNDPLPLPEMNVQLLIPQTFILVVVTRMYYRKQDDKPGYQPVSFAPTGTEVKA